MTNNNYDLIVVGGGPGGYDTAAYAANMGLKTLLIEQNEIGGTCLNRGCIPTKALLHSAHLLREIKGAGYFGINTDNISVDWNKIIQRKDRLIKRMQRGIEATLKQVTVIKGTASLNDDRSISINNDKYTSENIIIATGTTPANIPGITIDEEFVKTTDTIMDIKELPNTLVIIGGGVIGVEFADIFASFGVQVTIIELAADIVTGIDEDARTILKKVLISKKVRFINSTSVKKISKESKTLVLSSDEQISCDQVLMSIGRTANTNGFKDIEINEKGYIQTDDHLETNRSGIFAVGDVNGLSLFAHSATYQGLRVIDYIKTWDWKSNDLIPIVIFTAPQIATIGETNCNYQKADLMMVGRFQIDNDTEGFVKLFHNNEGIIIGATIVSQKAESLIGEALALINSKIKISELRNMIHPHPSASEIFTSF